MTAPQDPRGTDAFAAPGPEAATVGAPPRDGDPFPEESAADTRPTDAQPDPGPTDDEPEEGQSRRRDPEDWRWVVEARSSGDATPWSYGLALTFFTALLVGAAVYVLTSGLADVVLLDILVNLVVAAGLTPAIWLARRLPVLRWAAGGTALGIVLGWIGALVFLL